MNAIEAVATTPAERRRVRVCTTHSDGEVRVAVTDTGTGIPADRISEIFEPFYTTKGGGSGMGMGLAIAVFHCLGGSSAGRVASAVMHVPCGTVTAAAR